MRSKYDLRNIPFMFVELKLDDMPISTEAFRIYIHLLRRTEIDDLGEMCVLKSINKKCFPKLSSEKSNQLALRKFKELKSFNIIEFENDKIAILDKKDWQIKNKFK